MTDQDLLRWVYEMHKAELPLGEHQLSIHYAKQEQTWGCTGCAGKGTSAWPSWELKMTHEPDCKWLALVKRAT